MPRHPTRHFAVIALAAALAAAMLAGCGKAPKLERLDADATVLAFGDSLTFGTGAAADQSYPAVLQRLIGRKVIAAGVPGEASREGLARLPEALDEFKPQLLILCHGGNDFLRRLGEQNAAANVRAMVIIARGRGIAVVLIATPKPGLLPSAPEFYAEIAKEFGIPLEDGALKKVLTDNALKSDLIHPNAKGYARVAEAVAQLLKNAGAV
jgi:lysophospholipase L1-like esterase